MPKIYNYEQNSKGEYVLKNVREMNAREKRPKSKTRVSRVEMMMNDFLNGFAVGSFYIDRTKQLLRMCGFNV